MLANGYGWCSICHKWKTIGEFHGDSRSTTGLAHQCIRCASDNPDRLDRQLARNEKFGRGLKWCGKCDEWKRLEEFSKNKSTKDGYSTLCKLCLKLVQGDYYNRNRDRITKRNRKRYEVNKNKYLATGKRWKKNNPGKISASFHKRQARIKGMSGSFTDTQWKLLVAYYSPNNECLMCKRTDGKLTRDHVNPRGTNYISNIQPLCGPCNTRKMRKHIELRIDRGLYAKSLMKLNK